MSGGARILVSGASGVLGLNLVVRLCAALPRHVTIAALFRSEASVDEFRRNVRPAVLARVETVLCDLTRPADADAAAARLGRAERSIGVHCAADVAWDKPLDAVAPLNVDGSVRFAKLLVETARRPALIYVSSAYTRAHDWTYRNAYEESKALGERAVAAAFPALDTRVFSCSLVVGDQRTGRIERFHGLYPLVKFIACFDPPFLIGKRDCLIDIVPVDWTVEELLAVVRAELDGGGARGAVVAAAGPHRISLAALIAQVETRVNAFRVRHGGTARDAIPLLRHRQWAFLQRSLDAWKPAGLDQREFRYFERLLAIYRPYTETDDVLSPANLTSPPPDPRAYLPVVVDYWLSLHENQVLRRASSRKRVSA